MLTFHLLRLLQTRGIEKPFTWLRKNGFIHNTAHRLLKQPTILNIRYLEKLCHLLQCTPDELFRYTPTADAELPTGHPLNKLIRKEEPINLTQQLHTMPQQHLDKVWELINQLQSGTDTTPISSL